MDGSARRSHTEPRNYLASRRRAEFRNPLASPNAQNSMIPSAPSRRGVFFLGLRTTGSSRNRASGLLLALVNMGTEGEATRKMPKRVWVQWGLRDWRSCRCGGSLIIEHVSGPRKHSSRQEQLAMGRTRIAV